MPCIFICPAEREQYDLRRLARAPVGFFSVTAVLSFEPGLRRRYAATPFLVIPAPFDVGLLCPLRTDIPLMPRFLATGLSPASRGRHSVLDASRAFLPGRSRSLLSGRHTGRYGRRATGGVWPFGLAGRTTTAFFAGLDVPPVLFEPFTQSAFVCHYFFFPIRYPPPRFLYSRTSQAFAYADGYTLNFFFAAAFTRA